MIPLVLVVGVVALIWYLNRQSSAPSQTTPVTTAPAVPGTAPSAPPTQSTPDSSVRATFPVYVQPSPSIPQTGSWRPLGSRFGRYSQVQIAAGMPFRLSSSPQNFRVAAAQWNLGLTKDGFTAAVQNFLPMKGAQVSVWAPGEPLPPDWPSSDPAGQNGWRAQGIATSPATQMQLSGWNAWA